MIFSATKTNTLYFSVSTSFQSLSPSPEEWDNAVLRLGGSVYMTHDWLSTWWDFYGGKHSTLCLFVFRSEDKIVGLLPVYLTNLGIPPFRTKVARLIGSPIPPKVFNPPIDVEHAPNIFIHAILYLIQTARCDLVSFGPISQASEAWGAFPAAVAGWKHLASTSLANGPVHTIFRLPSTMEEFLQPFGKSRSKYRGRLELRPIKKSYPESHTDILVSANETEAEFSHFAEQHARQWLPEGKLGHFGDWPHGYEFNYTLVSKLSKLGRVRFTRVVANGQVIARQYVFVFGKCYYWELPSREIGPHYDTFRLGSTAALTMIDAAIKERVEWVEAGLGHYPYKSEIGGIEQPTLILRVSKRGLATRARLVITNTVRLFLSLFYFKLWFRRIQPRLPPVFRFAQAPTYLRFDY